MMATTRSGQHAFAYCGMRLPLQVLRSQAGFYIGTATDDGPCSRESVEYWPTEDAATTALTTGDWNQRDEP
ncbi:hypothetical protein WG898_17855 [Paucibacter sp. AS307]|uniref:hypothetical protein n=1 Tax=Paucibacter soli TaxID=3133433 RepID=UPI0030B48E1A